MPHVKDLPEGAGQSIPPVQMADAAMARRRAEQRLIQSVTPLDPITIEQALTALDIADRIHTRDGWSLRSDRIGDNTKSMLDSLGLDPECLAFWTFDDDDDKAYSVKKCEAAEIIGWSNVHSLCRECVNVDDPKRLEARFKMSSVARRLAALALHRERCLNAAAAGNPEPLAAHGAAFSEVKAAKR